MLILNCKNERFDTHTMGLVDLVNIFSTYPQLFKHSQLPTVLYQINDSYNDILNKQYIIKALLNIYAPELNMINNNDIKNENDNLNDKIEPTIEESIDYSETFKDENMEYIDPQTKDKHQLLLSQLHDLKNKLVQCKRQISHWSKICISQSEENVEFVPNAAADPLGPSTYSSIQLHAYQQQEQETQEQINRLEQSIQDLLDRNQTLLKEYYSQLSQKEQRLKDQQEQIEKEKYQKQQKEKEQKKLLWEKLLLEQKSKSNLPINYIKIILDQLQTDVNHLLTQDEIISAIVSLFKLEVLIAKEYETLVSNTNEANKLYNMLYDKNDKLELLEEINRMNQGYDIVQKNYCDILEQYKTTYENESDLDLLPTIVNELTEQFAMSTNIELVNNIIQFLVTSHKSTLTMYNYNTASSHNHNLQYHLDLKIIKNIDINSDLFHQIATSLCRKIMQKHQLTINDGQIYIRKQAMNIGMKSMQINYMINYLLHHIVEPLVYK